jgi:hypothetical protein
VHDFSKILSRDVVAISVGSVGITNFFTFFAVVKSSVTILGSTCLRGFTIFGGNPVGGCNSLIECSLSIAARRKRGRREGKRKLEIKVKNNK